MSGSISTKTSKDKTAEQTQAHSDEREHQVAPSGPLAQILALQQTAGNQAVNQLLESTQDEQPSSHANDHTEKASEKPLKPLPSANASVDDANGIPSIVRSVLKNGSGKPLEPETRAYMESRFGYDFGPVRIHQGTQAAKSAKAVNAKGYTVGRDIVFDQGTYTPGASAGRRLLAHELTHTIQQRFYNTEPPSLSTKSKSDQSAEKAAQCAMAGNLVGEVGGTGVGISRQVAERYVKELNPEMLLDYIKTATKLLNSKGLSDEGEREQRFILIKLLKAFNTIATVLTPEETQILSEAGRASVGLPPEETPVKRVEDETDLYFGYCGVPGHPCLSDRDVYDEEPKLSEYEQIIGREVDPLTRMWIFQTYFEMLGLEWTTEHRLAIVGPQEDRWLLGVVYESFFWRNLAEFKQAEKELISSYREHIKKSRPFPRYTLAEFIAESEHFKSEIHLSFIQGALMGAMRGPWAVGSEAFDIASTAKDCVQGNAVSCSINSILTFGSTVASRWRGRKGGGGKGSGGVRTVGGGGGPRRGQPTRQKARADLLEVIRRRKLGIDKAGTLMESRSRTALRLESQLGTQVSRPFGSSMDVDWVDPLTGKTYSSLANPGPSGKFSPPNSRALEKRLAKVDVVVVDWNEVPREHHAALRVAVEKAPANRVQQLGQPVPLLMRESAGARGSLQTSPRRPPEVVEAEQMGFIDPRSNQGASATAQTPRSLTTSILADLGEEVGYLERLHQGEIGIIAPQGSNVRGLDYCTVNREPNGQIWIYVVDAKTRVSATSNFGRLRRDLPQTWINAVEESIRPGRLDLGDEALEDAIRDAFVSKRLRLRRDTIDFSPAGQGRVQLNN